MNLSAAALPSAEIITTIETITPEMATRWLANNTINRKIRQRRVKQWAKKMLAGQWAVTHQGIAFDTEGRLIDGQHRLLAIVEAGVAVTMMVTRNLPFETYAVFDQGAFRSAADILKTSTRRVSALRSLVSLENYSKFAVSNTAEDARDLEQRVNDGVEDLDILLDLTASKRYGTMTFSGPVVAALAYAYPIAKEIVETFISQLRTGEMLAKDDPAFRLREWFARAKDSRYAVIALRWKVMMVVLQAFHHLLKIEGKRKVAHIIVGETGYRFVTTRRRVKKIPHTPSVNLITAVSLSNSK